MVTKLAEGRLKRLKALEKSHREQKKDLDQRSLDTCAVRPTCMPANKPSNTIVISVNKSALVQVSANHLEEFMVKAERKRNEASEESINAVKTLKDLIRASHILKKSDEGMALVV